MSDVEIQTLFEQGTKNQHNVEVTLPVEALSRLGYAGPIVRNENGKATVGFDGNAPAWVAAFIRDGLHAVIAGQAERS